jgi:hypothetical protein
MAARHNRRDRARRKGFRHDPSLDLVAPPPAGSALWLRSVDDMLDHIDQPLCARCLACCRSARWREGGVRRPLTVYRGPKLINALAGSGKWTIEVVTRSQNVGTFKAEPKRWVINVCTMLPGADRFGR